MLTAAGLVLATGGDWDDDLLGDAAGGAGARPARARGDQPRRRAGLCRLCPHRRRARSRDRRASPARRRAADHRVRRRRRPRPGQAAGDGARSRPRFRRRHRHRRQSAQRGSRRDPRARSWPAAPGAIEIARPPRSHRRGDPDGAARATSCCLPARATRPARSSATACFRSTTPWSRGSARRDAP